MPIERYLMQSSYELVPVPQVGKSLTYTCRGAEKGEKIDKGAFMVITQNATVGRVRARGH
jgi:hypothetical protein